MSRRVSVPKIDARRESDLLRQLRRMAPHYTTEWRARDEDDPGVALLKIFSNIAEGVVNRLNRAPERNFLAFLDMLGIRLLPKTPARVPVTFRVVDGTEKPFIIRAGTQVAAGATDTRPEELPFETIENLLAIPAKLVAMYAVDPQTDRIHRSPPQFLELEKVENLPPELKVTAFSSAKSKFLQLEPPGQVKEGDFLRIEHKLSQNQPGRNCIPGTNQSQQPVIDHLVVSAVKGSIVTVTDPLPRDYLEGTPVRKETQFELFEAKNWQEHVLYLAHEDYFAIKSEAEIEFLVEHAPGASANLQPFKIVWEFFGVIDSDPLKEQGWHRFTVDLDGTVGFSQDGRVVLLKPAGEIKETEINGSKSRWIRARLDDPLPATPATPQPTFESIQLAVSSGGENLPPDQAFHNDTPLTTDVEFFPFGTEPRIFDRFSIASEEAFSKHGAEIELTLGLDTSGLLASPAAVFAKNKVPVFAKAAAGKLFEFQIDPSRTLAARPAKYDKPKDIKLTAGSIPAVVTDANETIGVFAKADNGKMYILTSDEPDPPFKPLAETPGTLQFDPAAIVIDPSCYVFAVADNKLYQKILAKLPPDDADRTKENWSSFSAADLRVDSTPFVLADGSSYAVFITDTDRITWMFRQSIWTKLTPEIATNIPKKDYLAAKNARPFARRDLNGNVQIFLRNEDNKLVRIDTTDPNNNNVLEAPPPGFESNPFGSSFAKHDDRIYVRAKDDRLWSINGSANPPWTNRGTSSDINLDGDPFVIAYPPADPETVSVFLTSKKNALMEFRRSIIDLGPGPGNIQAGPQNIVRLEDQPQLAGVNYIHILSGPGADSEADAVRKFNDQLTKINKKFVVLESPPLSDSPTIHTSYELFREEASGDVQDATDYTLTLENGAGSYVDNGDFVFAGNQLRQIPVKPHHGDDVVTVDRRWDPLPTDTYVLLRVDQGTQGDYAEGPSDLCAVLDQSFQAPNGTYNDKFLHITSGPGESPIGREIEDYFHDTNHVVLANKFDKAPDSSSTFAIRATGVSEAWFVHKDPDQAELQPELSWEYWNGTGWVALPIITDTTAKLLFEGNIKFVIPDDIEKTEIAGQENYWIRARLVGGDYGREVITVVENPPKTSDGEDAPKTSEVKIDKSSIRPPLVNEISISYKLTEMKDPQFCLTFNNLNYLDQTAANTTADKHFKPYVPLSDTDKTVYFGFDQAFEGAPVNIYFAAKELEVDERKKPKLIWQFAFENDWKTVLAKDYTAAFTKPEFVSLTLPKDFQNTQQFGRALYWLRATLAEGEWKGSPLFDGVFINTVEALQARTVRDEILGSSTGVKNQLFRLQQTPVIPREETISGEEIIPGEVIRVREALTDREREELIAELGKDAVLTIKDQQGRVIETWIKWTGVIEFFDSEPGSRHYRLDRHTGELEFGDGRLGRIPPPGGDNIRAFAYQAGGGAAGNVAPGEINSPVTAVAGVDTVINPVAAGGGSEAATNEDMMEIGPEQISNRDRAVTPDDFEQLAREASREVRKSLCLPNRNAAGRYETGWTSVHIVPDSKDAEPKPSLELRRSVQRFLAQRADLTLVEQDHLFVGPPEYVPVSVEGKVFARSLDVVSIAEQNAIRKLDQFLHPLTGGFDGKGWDFGRDLAVSDLYRILEDIEEVDHVEQLLLRYGNRQSEERVEVSANALLASGTHKISMSVATRE